MGHLRKLVHTARMPIRWGDMDAMGHVNNTMYFRYMEQTRIEWLYACAQRLGIGACEGQGPVIVNASCTFHVPLTYPGEAEVRMFVGPPGKSSRGACRACSHVCVAGQTAMNARRSAQRIARPIRKPSNTAGAPFGRNPKGRGRFGRIPLLPAAGSGRALRRGRRLGLPPKAPPSHARQ